jgi:integrase
MGADRVTLPVGIRRLPSGRYQVRIRLGGTLHAKGFPATTDLSEMIAWRQARYAKAVLGLADDDATAPTFAADCRRYLAIVRGMPTYQNRAQQIVAWQQAFGARTRAAIASSDIRKVLDGWRRRTPRPLAPSSCNRYRTALMHLWTVLDGKSAPNPVRDVPAYPEPTRALRLPTLDEAERAIAAFATDSAGRPYPTKGRTSRARLRVLLWTGWPPSQLMRLSASDVDLEHAVAYLPPRRKGRGAAGRRLPLLPQAVSALRDLDACAGWGAFSLRSLRTRLHVACASAGVRPFRIYDLRHKFLTMIAAASRDDRAVAELAGHTSPQQTRRYTTASVDERMQAALDAVARATFAGRSG